MASVKDDNPDSPTALPIRVFARTAYLAMVVCTSLSAQAASQAVHTDVSSPTAVDTEERANKWIVLAIAGGAAFMTTLDSSIVNISLPAIARNFGVPLAGSIEWVVIGYLVVIAALLLTVGRLADQCRLPWRRGLRFQRIPHPFRMSFKARSASPHL